jgi:hypothetical protein
LPPHSHWRLDFAIPVENTTDRELELTAVDVRAMFLKLAENPPPLELHHV